MSTNPKTQAREYAVQFLYQSEAERLHHFSESHFNSFVSHFQVPEHLIPSVRELTRGPLERLADIDARLQDASANWKLNRMAVIDRNVLRLALYELLSATAPHKVVMNEAIELAKKYGSAESGAFVNGLLDKLARNLRSESRRSVSQQPT